MQTRELKLKRVKLAEMRVGMPLPWAVYFSSGDMAMDIGFIPDSEEQVEALMERGLYRYPTELEAKAEPEEHAALDWPKAKPAAARAEPPAPRGENTTLEQIKLNIGDSIQLQIKSEFENERYVVTLIGYLSGEGLIITTPVVNGSVLMVREGQTFVVRTFSGKSAYAFTASATRVTNSPYPHIHLSYPKEVRGLVVRGSSRARTNIICHASSPANEKGYACVARDISIGGTLISAKEKIGEVGDKITLKMRVNVNEAEHMLILDCEIRSANASRTEGGDNGKMLHGLSFHNLNSQDKLVLSALLYQNMINEQQAAD